MGFKSTQFQDWDIMNKTAKKNKKIKEKQVIEPTFTD